MNINEPTINLMDMAPENGGRGRLDRDRRPVDNRRQFDNVIGYMGG